MPHYTRAWIPGGTFFFTVALLDRRRSLLTEHIDTLRSAFRKVREHHPFRIDAIVVLPEHFHTLWTLPSDDTDFPTRMRLIKSTFSRALPPDEHRSAVRQRRHERGIWQRGYWEHAIRDDEDLHRHLDYIHYNPVKHGLVAQPGDWPHSSFRRFVKAGLYPEDWAAVPAEQLEFGE